MRMPRVALFLMVPLALLACEPAEVDDAEMAEGTEPATEMGAAAMDEQAIDAAMDQLRNSWIEAAEARDAAGVAALYTTDAMMVSPTNPEPMSGRRAIQQGLAPGFETLSSIEVTSQDREMGPDLVTDMGSYSQTFEGPDGETTVEGYYLVVSRRQADGSWKIVQHLSSVPQPMEDPGLEDDAGMAADTTAPDSM